MNAKNLIIITFLIAFLVIGIILIFGKLISNNQFYNINQTNISEEKETEAETFEKETKLPEKELSEDEKECGYIYHCMEAKHYKELAILENNISVCENIDIFGVGNTVVSAIKFSCVNYFQKGKEIDSESISTILLLRENDLYAVYLINLKDIPPTKTGEIAVYDKSKEKIIRIEGNFSIFGQAILYNDEKGRYLLLSAGTYTLREAIVISLITKKQAIENFCIAHKPYFWENFIIYQNCDCYDDGTRPWGVGQAPSIAAVNLKTGKEKIIFKSNLTRQFGIKKIEDSTLTIEKTFVDKAEDWHSVGLEKTEIITFNLIDL